MTNYLTIGLSALALAATATAGYRVGAWRLDGCRTELTTIQQQGQAGQALSRDAQRALDERQAALEKDRQAKLDAMTRSFDAERTDLQKQLSQAGERIKALQGKSVTTDSDLVRVRQQILAANGSANAPLLQKLQDQERALVGLKTQLAQQQASLVCLQAPVPSQEVSLLNRSLVETRLETKP